MLRAAQSEAEDPTPSPGGPRDEALERARAGDPAAFADLVHEHQAMVFSLALHVLRNRALAEEVAQEVFLELHRSLERLDTSTHLVFWLRRVTSHRCIDEVRRSRHRWESAFADVPERPVLPFSRDIFLEERLRGLVGELPVQARLVVVLRYQEDLQPTEIAAVLGMSINTVKSHLRRSLGSLRSGLLKRGLCV